MNMLRLQVMNLLSSRYRVLNLRPGAGSDIPANVDDKDLVSHVNLPLVHVIQHFLGAFSPYLFVSGMAEEPDADDDVSFEGKAFLRFNELVFEASAAAEGYDFVWALHQR